MEDDDLRYGMRCKFLREEIVDMDTTGGKVIRTLVRTDGLKHRNVTCAFIIHRDTDTTTLYNGTLIVRCFGVCCECALTIRVRLKVLIGSETVRTHPWQERIAVREDAPTVRFSGLLQLGDFEAATKASTHSSVVEIQLMFDIVSAAPGFLLAPKVPTFQLTSLCDEEREMALISCSDGSLWAERTLLMRESPRWKSRLSDLSDATPVDCMEFSVTDMKVFLFFLQTQLFFDLARFDTFNTVARIAVRQSVSSVVRRCAIFVNDCVILAETGRKSAETSGTVSASATATPESQAVSSKVRWTPDDLILIWRTTVCHLAEEGLAKALMRLICQSSYTDIKELAAFQQLDASTKSSFYHQYLLCRESANNAALPGR